MVSLQLFLIQDNTKFNTKAKINSPYQIREEQIDLFIFVQKLEKKKKNNHQHHTLPTAMMAQQQDIEEDYTIPFLRIF